MVFSFLSNETRIQKHNIFEQKLTTIPTTESNLNEHLGSCPSKLGNLCVSNFFLSLTMTSKKSLSIEGSRKKRPFYGPDRKQMWKLVPIFSLTLDSLILKRHFISLWGASKMHFSCPQHLRYTVIHGFCDRATANRKEELGIIEVGWKWLFSCVKSVSEHIIIISSQ